MDRHARAGAGIAIAGNRRQPVENVDRLLDAARNEACEQCDVVVGDMVVDDATVAAIADVLGTDEIVVAQQNCETESDWALAEICTARWIFQKKSA